jgi:hypothetical protein
VKNHPLPDGNKRAAFLTMVEFIERNGLEWVAPRVSPRPRATRPSASSKGWRPEGLRSGLGCLDERADLGGRDLSGRANGVSCLGLPGADDIEPLGELPLVYMEGGIVAGAARALLRNGDREWRVAGPPPRDSDGYVRRVPVAEATGWRTGDGSSTRNMP